MSTSRPEPKRVARERLAEEREKQQAAEKAKERTLRLLVIGVVVLLVVGIAGLVFWQQNKPVDAAQIPAGADPKTGAISVGTGPVDVPLLGGTSSARRARPSSRRIGSTFQDQAKAGQDQARLPREELPRRQPAQRQLDAGGQRGVLRPPTPASSRSSTLRDLPEPAGHTRVTVLHRRPAAAVRQGRRHRG